MIKYLGSKRTLLGEIVALVGLLPGVRRVVDLFSGSARVGHALKAAGYEVTANDHNAYAHCLASCYVAADRARVEHDAGLLLDELARLPGSPGYFTSTFCERARFFQPKNGERIDAIREAIDAKSLAPDLRAVVLVSLMEAADRVDSTCGLQMAYLKSWAPRSHRPLELRLPACLPGLGAALSCDAALAAGVVDADLAYLDPPYNQHSYLRNYHVWESLIRWDKPEVYGVACKRTDCKDRTSLFNSRRTIAAALAAVIDATPARQLVVSFNDEGHLHRDELVALLGRRGPVRVLEFDARRYVGARIGIYNPAGERVGRVSHVRNKEWLFVVGEGVERLPIPLAAPAPPLAEGLPDASEIAAFAPGRPYPSGPGEEAAQASPGRTSVEVDPPLSGM